MHWIIQRHRAWRLGGQVVLAEDIQVGIQAIGGALVAGQLQTQRGDFGRAEMVIALERRSL